MDSFNSPLPTTPHRGKNPTFDISGPISQNRSANGSTVSAIQTHTLIESYALKTYTHLFSRTPMSSVTSFFRNLANSISSEANNFDAEMWCMLALVAVVGGYFLLRGNMLKAT